MFIIKDLFISVKFAIFLKSSSRIFLFYFLSNSVGLKLCGFLCLFLAVPGLCCSAVFSLVAASRGYSIAVVHGLLVLASLVVEQGL